MGERTGIMNQVLSLSIQGLSFLLLLSALSTTACQSSSVTRRAQESAELKPDPTPPAFTPSPDVQIFVDEAMLRKPNAILGGTLKNVSTEKLEHLSIELELIRRTDGHAERRVVKVEPSEIAPGGSGKYSIKVLSEEWSGSRIIRLQTSREPRQITFKALPGARRPPEKITPVTRLSKEGKPRTNSKGDEYINTPDNPIAVP
ncbi:MAG: hypothetical protein LC802_10575 [Acidobacteria bacterium]|nr:hypothetical protein [Acidobacteriota bacterium]